MGCSNPHPHGQVWCTTGTPEEPALELESLQKYRKEHGGSHMLVDYAKLESEKKERVVFENESFLAVCPWWATWPFEIMIIARTHKRALVDFNDKERQDLAEAIAEVTRRYDNLFETQFPYSMLRSIFCEIEATNMKQAWVFTKHRLKVHPRRLRPVTSTCTFILPSSAALPCASSWSVMR